MNFVWGFEDFSRTLKHETDLYFKSNVETIDKYKGRESPEPPIIFFVM